MGARRSRGDKRWMDGAAVAILDKWKTRLGKGWEPSDSDVLRHMDALLEAHERDARERERAQRPRRVGIGPR